MTKYQAGQWNAVCDRCGFEFKSSELRKDWQGLMVCSKDYEARHPQDFIKTRAERPAPAWTRPEGEDVFLFSCDLWSSSPMAGFGEAGCMTVGGFSNIPFLIDTFNPSCIAGVAIAGRSIPGVE
jgi:hypothetical protein